MVSAPYARKNRGKLKLPFVPSRPISRNQFCRSRGRSHIYICTGPADARPAWPDLQMHGQIYRRADGHAEARTDTQRHGRTRRSTDADADTRTQTQKHGRRRTDADADADARTQSQAPDGAGTLNICACSAWVEKSSRRVLHLDERTRTFEVYYTSFFFFLLYMVFIHVIVHVIVYTHPYLLYMSLCIFIHTYYTCHYVYSATLLLV